MAEAPALFGLNTVLALALVLGLLVLLAAALRWLAPRLSTLPDGGHRIELLASRVLDNRSRATLLRCGGRRYLIVATAGGVCLLDSYSDDAAAAGEETHAGG